MSAFVVGREHIRYVVDAALRMRPKRLGDFRYFHLGKWHRLIALEYDAVEGDVTPEQFGQMLWDENIRSVLFRYPGDTRETMPGPVGETFVYDKHRHVREVTPEQAIRAVQCLMYQSCEHDEWERSAAHAACKAIIEDALDRILSRVQTAWEITDADNVTPREAVRS